MIDPDNRSLEQTPEVLHAHCVDVSVDECFGVADSCVLSLTSGLLIALEFIGDEQFGTDTDKGVEERGQRLGLEVLDNLSGNVTASLFEPHYDLFSGCTTTTLPARFLPADVDIISFDDTAELVLKPHSWPHALPNLHPHPPSRLIRHPYCPL